MQNRDHGNVLMLQEKSIVDWINHGIDFTQELVPCKGLDCPEWKKWESRGGCILLIKAGKHGSYKRPQGTGALHYYIIDKEK
jgi:hypothetical protein